MLDTLKNLLAHAEVQHNHRDGVDDKLSGNRLFPSISLDHKNSGENS